MNTITTSYKISQGFCVNEYELKDTNVKDEVKVREPINHVFCCDISGRILVPSNMELDKVIGLAYWGAIDYLGESGAWPARGSEAGLLDLAGNVKPNGYYRASLWSDNAVLCHMKDLWTCLGKSFTGCESSFKQLKKSASLADYLSSAREILSYAEMTI